MSEKMCHCGRPLHYRDPSIRVWVEKMIAEQGEFITVTVARRSWKVPRHYIALHALKACE